LVFERSATPPPRWWPVALESISDDGQRILLTRVDEITTTPPCKMTFRTFRLNLVTKEWEHIVTLRQFGQLPRHQQPNRPPHSRRPLNQSFFLQRHDHLMHRWSTVLKYRSMSCSAGARPLSLV